MADEFEEQVPGVTLFFKANTLTKTVGTEKLRTELLLECVVRDEELWEKVSKKLTDPKGVRFFTEDDFHVEVMSVMREKVHDLEREKFQLGEQLKSAVAEKDAAVTECAKYRGAFDVFGRSLG
jgi:hypothetical protein